LPQRQALADTIKEEVLAELGRNAYYRTGGTRSGSYLQSRREMVDSVKTDVMAQIEAEQEALERQREMAERYNDSVPAGTRWDRRLTPGERQRIKEEVLWELRPDPDGYSPAYYGQGSGVPYSRPSAVDRVIVENIKNELMAEMEAGQMRRTGTTVDNWRNFLSDRNIDRMIQQHYRNLGALRGDIRRGLESVRDIDNRVNSISDPQVREAVGAIIREAREEGLSLDQVIRRLNDGTGTGWGRRAGDWFGSSQGRGFLWGIGATVVAAMLFPVTRKGLRNIAVKTMEGTMDMADHAKMAFGRTKEGFEDMIAEANFHSMQEEEKTYSVTDESNPDNPENGEPVH
jgi:hypothetical protein